MSRKRQSAPTGAGMSVQVRFAAERSEDAHLAERVPGRQTRSMPSTVLIVDDHPSFRAAARRLLELEGWTVVGEAVDGESAIAAALALRPEVVLLDVGLPDIDGFQVAERLRAINGGPRVVLTSSRDWSDYGRALQRTGACGFLPKGELSGPGFAAALAA
jgi:DNA-binding NarL/FixJ family response regulator